MKIISAFLSVLFMAGSAYAAEPIQSPVFIQTTVSGEPGMAEGNAYDVFGGQKIILSLLIYGTRNHDVEIKAELLQDASGISKYVAKNIQVSSGLDFTEIASRIIDFPLEIPSVERRSAFRIRYYANAGDRWLPAGFVRFNVYPNNFLEPIKTFSKKNAICLFGENQTLNKFFKSKEIKVDDWKDVFPTETEGPVLILSEFLDKEWYKIPKELQANQVMAVFYPQVTKGIPIILIKPAGRGVLMEVNLPVLENFNNPKTQEMLVEIFEIAGDYLLKNSRKIPK
jgi:hypothetical protein